MSDATARRRSAHPLARRGSARPRSGREVAHDVVVAVDHGGARVAPALDEALRGAGLDDRDRRQATDLVYGVVRRRRFLDHALDVHLRGSVEPVVRAALRIGAFELLERAVPAHAAVSEAVSLAPRRARGLVNAVLRRVATSPLRAEDAPLAVRLSYPDWIVERLTADLGATDAHAALAAMNEPVETPRRADGYRQDPASGWVVDVVGARPGEVVVDACAAPGGKATALAGRGARIVAMDLDAARARSMRGLADELGVGLAGVLGDARHPPLRIGAVDRVLVDAPCSGLGALRRRADARWRITPADIDRLVGVQRQILAAAVELVSPGGLVVYSVCTLTTDETTRVVDAVTAVDDRSVVEEIDLGRRWRRSGSGVVVLPQDHRTDGMFVAALRRRDV